MPEYDAFGREIGDDPLASLRSATDPAPAREEPAAPPEPAREAPAARPEPVEDTAGPELAPAGDRAAAAGDGAAAPDLAAPPDLAAWSGARGPEASPAPDAPRVPPPRIEFVRPQRRRRGRGGLAALLVLAAVLGVFGLVAGAVVEKGGEIIDEIAPQESAPPATGLQTGSWLRRANFADALAMLKSVDLGKPMQIRIAPDRIDATLIKGDRLHIVQIKGNELTELASNAGSGPAIPFSAIDPAAPEKLVRRGANAKHPARSIDYVLVNPGPPPNVAAYFKGGRIVIGDRHGRPQRVL